MIKIYELIREISAKNNSNIMDFQYFYYMKQSNIFIGKKIAEIMSAKKITKAELARRLEVRPQSVDYLLTRKSIDTDTLYCVSKALDYDFAQLYSIKIEQTDFDNKKKAGIEMKSAKIVLEFELNKEALDDLNLNDKISDFFEK